MSDPVRQDLFDHVLPTLVKESGSLLAPEIPAIIQEFNAPEADIRLQASGLLFTLVSFRLDSTSTMAGVIPAFIAHLDDSSARVRKNSLNALASYNPEIPNEALTVLIREMRNSDQSTAIIAARGVVRMMPMGSPLASTAIFEALEGTEDSTTVVVLRAIAAVKHATPTLVSRLGALLARRDASIVRESLLCIEALGPSAVKTDSPQIESLATTATDPELAEQARKLLASVNPSAEGN